MSKSRTGSVILILVSRFIQSAQERVAIFPVSLSKEKYSIGSQRKGLRISRDPSDLHGPKFQVHSGRERLIQGYNDDTQRATNGQL